MTETDSVALLTKAQENIEAARYLLDGDYVEVAVTRAYYAMFSSGQALLLETGITGSSHKRVISAFGEYLVHSGEAPETLHRTLSRRSGSGNWQTICPNLHSSALMPKRRFDTRRRCASLLEAGSVLLMG